MQLIRSTSELAEICSALARHPFVAVDTEFMREHTFYSDLCLVQLAGPEHEVLVDPLAQSLSLDPLWDLLDNPDVTKVFHAGRQDIEIFWNRTGRVPRSVFDTQVAAMVCGFGESISYVNLVREITGTVLDKSSRFSDWSRRPLNKAQLTYALADVTHLRELYPRLVDELARSGRSTWVAEEMQDLVDPGTYATPPADAWRRLKARVKSRKAMAVLIELAAWRETKAQHKNIPRQRVLKDEQLYDIANQAPTSVEALGDLRSLGAGFARSDRGSEIIAAVKAGLARDPRSIPAPQHTAAPTQAHAALIDLLRVLLKSAAARHKVAARLIADSDDIDRIAVEDDPDIPALKGWRRELFGEDALRLKRGEISLTIEKGEIVARPV